MGITLLVPSAGLSTDQQATDAAEWERSHPEHPERTPLQAEEARPARGAARRSGKQEARYSVRAVGASALRAQADDRCAQGRAWIGSSRDLRAFGDESIAG